jgi:hypothetical protein
MLLSSSETPLEDHVTPCGNAAGETVECGAAVVNVKQHLSRQLIAQPDESTYMHASSINSTAIRPGGTASKQW